MKSFTEYHGITIVLKEFHRISWYYYSIYFTDNLKKMWYRLKCTNVDSKKKKYAHTRQ